MPGWAWLPSRRVNVSYLESGARALLSGAGSDWPWRCREKQNARDPRRVEGLADDDPGWMDGSRCRWCYWFLDCSQMAGQSHPPESNKAPLSLPLCLLCRVIVLPVLYITKADSL